VFPFLDVRELYLRGMTIRVGRSVTKRNYTKLVVHSVSGQLHHSAIRCRSELYSKARQTVAVCLNWVSC
jgi:hypothetical protein